MAASRAALRAAQLAEQKAERREFLSVDSRAVHWAEQKAVHWARTKAATLAAWMVDPKAGLKAVQKASPWAAS